MRIRSLVLAALLAGGAVRGDEGMWTFDNVPLGRIQAKYGVALDAGWLEHVRLSALGFPTGSGAFVSRDGLVATNHHVARAAIEAAAKARHQDLLDKGFLAATLADEIPIPDLVIRTLLRTENVTAQVKAAAKPGMDDRQAEEARQKKLRSLGEDLAFKTKLRVSWESFYHGGEYWLYAYQEHKDVRLVAAPEKQIAFYGGDPDNFTYPRHDLDFALLRVYQVGEPYHPAHYLRWSRDGVRDGELTFVVGRPGETLRQETVAQMAFRREVDYPADLALRKARRDALREFAQGSAADAGRVGNQIFFAENGIKATEGYLSGLADAGNIAALERREGELRAAVARDPLLRSQAGESWARMEAALEQLRPTIGAVGWCNRRNSALLSLALDLVRVVDQEARPVQDRLRDYRDGEQLANRKWSIRRSQQVENLDLEAFLIGKGLEDLDRELAPGDPLRKQVLDGRKPMDVAREAVQGSRMDKGYFRDDLILSGAKALGRSKDPLVRLALALEARDRENLARQEPLRATVKENWDRIVRAGYALQGADRYPDADFSPRITYGPVAGLVDQGAAVPPFTTFQDALFSLGRQPCRLCPSNNSTQPSSAAAAGSPAAASEPTNARRVQSSFMMLPCQYNSYQVGT